MEPRSPSVTCLPQRKIFAQRRIERLIGNEQLIIHPRRPGARTKVFDMRIDLCAIGGLNVFGNHFDLSIGFQIDEDRRSLHHRPYLLRIENMKQHYLVPVESQWRDITHNGFRILEEIGDHDRNPAPVEKILKVKQGFGKTRARPRLRALQTSEETSKLARPRGWPDVLAHLVVEDNQSSRIALVADGKIKKRCRDEIGRAHV